MNDGWWYLLKEADKAIMTFPKISKLEVWRYILKFLLKMQI